MSGGKRSGLAFALSCTFLSAIPCAVPASELASVAGVVADTSGSPLAGAHVTLEGTGVSPSNFVTRADGAFRFWAVKPDAGYHIRATMDGYRTVEYEGLHIESSRRRDVNFRLKRPGEWEAVVIASRDPFPYTGLVAGFEAGLGLPMRLVDLDGEQDPRDAVRRVAAEKPNVILAAGLSAGRLVRSEIPDVPSILALIDDPRRYDLEAPNICFLASNPDPAALLDRLAVLLPGTRRIAVLYDADPSELLARDIRSAATERGLEVETLPCYGTSDLVRALAAMPAPPDALIVPYDGLAIAPGAREAISRWALHHRVRLLAPRSAWLEKGALMSLEVPDERLGAEAAAMALDILFGGRQPQDIGVRVPEVMRLAVSHDVAAALGLSLPEADGPDR
jgi:ABC-type uncharacterized transport system substrate-binding protein